ncbi:MAG: TIGR01777 family oxidoreductase [Candidatus Binatia bacterium]|nr:TIGR01777 family oxidoreductase [Candidatus Binatia bacterium]MDG1958884.1 TIGR01777 family oxidoreductase [Candidatus Binatia bacterium]MDG2011098.1 TIGR01777 family oxidoreductase [Candidatus Binatia bacterium]
MRILVVGGTGLVGKRLCAALALAGHDLRAVSRNVPRSVPHLPPGTDLRPLPKTDDEWTSLVDGCNAIFNLAGEGLVEGRWSEDRKKSLRDSRVSLTDSLVRACGATVRRPRVLVNASAIGFYGPHGDEDLNESSAPGDDFLAEMCVAWEQAALAAKDVGLRVVTVRIGVVLSMNGGSLGKMLPPFRLGLGGPFGTGEQYFSWVHEDDLTGLLIHALDNESVEGAMNGTAPNPVRNGEFAKTLGGILNRPAFLSPPDFVIRLALGEVADAILLTGQKVLPAVAQKTGYKFRYETAEDALRALLDRPAAA